jgi:putative chitinase
MKEIQSKLNLKPDGVFGPKTAAAMAQHLKLSKEEAAHFLGQCVLESGSFTKMREEFHRYTEANLLSVFPKYFVKYTPIMINGKIVQQKAADFVGKPEKIANWVYANRMGNGGPESGDGWKFRGAGPLQLTGKSNFELFSNYVKDPEIMKNTDLVGTKYQLESARFFFDRNNIWRHCKEVNDNTILTVSRIINVGNANSKVIPNHLKERVFHTKRVHQWLS